MKEFDTLYARNSNGKINEWTIHTVVRNTYGVICINEGIIDGIKTSNERVIKQGKNIGKMNSTTAYEQACNEAQSRWEKKKKQGYKSLQDLGVEDTGIDYSNLEERLPKDRTDANNISKPMKAQQYFKDDGSVRIKFPCYGQPKLNGFRVMARWEKVMEGEGIFAQEVEKVVFRSKEGLRYDILEHIEKEFTKDMFTFLDHKEGFINHSIAYDGEMYIHGEILSEISSAVRKRNSKTPLLKFYIFDLAMDNMKQSDRLSNCCLQISHERFNNIKYVPNDIIDSNEMAQKYTDVCIKNGYEGAIFRDMKAEYQFGKRPQTMVKLKRSQDKEFKITDVIGGDNSPELGIFVCIAENGNTFKVTPEGTHEQKKEYLTNKLKYIGKNLTVRFFERTKDDLPFHAVGIVIRDYET